MKPIPLVPEIVSSDARVALVPPPHANQVLYDGVLAASTGSP